MVTFSVNEKSNKDRTMIELKKDGLSFSFPQVAESMRKLEKEYVQETLP